MATLSPTQIVALIRDVDTRLNDGKITRWQLVTATYIVLRESGGKTDAFRDASKNTQGGNDRGLWQINSKWHPEVSDMVANNPVAATEWALGATKGWTNWCEWNGGCGDGKVADYGQIIVSTNKYFSEDAYDKAAKAVTESGSPPEPIPGAIPEDTDTLGLDDIPGVGVAMDIGGAVTSLVGKLMSPSFWKRIGIGALGLAIIAIALALYLSKTDTAQQVTEAATP